jgi:hypothetical protein
LEIVDHLFGFERSWLVYLIIVGAMVDTAAWASLFDLDDRKEIGRLQEPLLSTHRQTGRLCS